MMALCDVVVVIEHHRRRLGLPIALVDMEYGNNGIEI
tara:strand:+ start:382 stop:492 length:111 start_codon:yes stop_codon:yes gene_type:complete